jgi:hypothetical protein
MDQEMISQAFVQCADASARRNDTIETLAAEREFRRSRRRAVLRAIRRAINGDEPTPGMLRFCGGEEAWIDLREIAGYEDAAGEAVLGLPPLSRKLLKAWCDAYRRMVENEEKRSFRLRPHRGAWYLVGGSEAQVGLEIARMRGESRVRVKLEALTTLCPDAAVDRKGRSEGDLGAA